MGTREAKERLKAAAFVSVAVVALGFVYVFNPNGSRLYPACPFLGLTGCYCPGCGSLRAVHNLLRGNVLAAFGLNPLTVLSLPFMGYFFASCLAKAVTGRYLKTFFIQPAIIWTLLFVIVAFWILRNVPFHPFSLLAP